MRWLAASVIAATCSAFGADKPAIVFYQPPECGRPCDTFAQAVAHPAMQRRLAAVSFEIKPLPEGEKVYLAAFDRSGREAMRWSGMPDWLMLADILSLVETAGPHLDEALGADPVTAEREWPLAVLALGDEDRGRTLLEAMRTSASVENRELATIWLERLNALKRDVKPREELLAGYARNGSSDRVRFEAWMAVGDVRLGQDRVSEAIAAYDRAAEFTEAGTIARRSALAARQRAAATAVPVLGLGSPGSIVAGRRLIQPRAATKNVSRVELRLDGKLVATARKAPFAASVPFGRIPKRQVLEIVSRNKAGGVLSRSSIVVNERSDAFTVDFVEPSGTDFSGDVQLAVRVPNGRSAEQLTVEWNGARVAQFTAPPYRAHVKIPSGEQGVLRAVLRLDDGSETEDVVLANSGSMPYEASAHLVEVPAYFEDDPPAPGNVVVREGGVRRTVEQIIRPEGAPLLVALLIDTSRSMTPLMLDVQEATVRFLEQNIQARDQMMIVSFDSTAHVLLHPTSDRAMVERSVLALRPRGATALYDAVIAGLLQMQSSGSRKAMIVFSDGLDATSVFSSGDAAEVARRAGVPIYVVVFDPVEPIARKRFMPLSRSTGGWPFEIGSLADFAYLWSRIGEDLKKQSIVIYRTDNEGAEWRPLEISIKGGKPVRAPAGVYVTR